MTSIDDRPHLICIDDDEAFRSDLVDELARAGFAVTGVSNAKAALAILRVDPPDLILCDISMPGSDGYDVLRSLRESDGALATIPFVFLTGLAGRNELLLGKKLGADDYLTKPVDYELLLATISARLQSADRARSAAIADLDKRRLELASSTLGLELRDFSSPALERLGIGVLLVDKDCTLLRTNGVADELLAEADCLRRTGNMLVSPSVTTGKALRSALRASGGAKAQAIVAERPDRQPLLLMIAPVSGESENGLSLVTVADPLRPPKLSEDTAAALYGLTPMEAKVSIAIASGKRPEEVTSGMGIAQSTVNFHLNNIFRKTGTSRQVDLAMLMMRTALVTD